MLIMSSLFLTAPLQAIRLYIHWAKDSTVQCADLFPRNETNVARIGQKGCGFRSS